MTSPTPRAAKDSLHSNLSRPDSLIRRSWHALTERLSPFSSTALATLPNTQRPRRYNRGDNIPEVEEDADGNMPTVRDYNSINGLPPKVRVPKKIATPIKVEGKVWFANERTWLSWLDMSIVIGTLAVALLNASSDGVARKFAYFYGGVSLAVLAYGYVLYQHRITLIRRRDPGTFDALTGPLILSALLFFGILANFVIRVRELRRTSQFLANSSSPLCWAYGHQPPPRIRRRLFSPCQRRKCIYISLYPSMILRHRIYQNNAILTTKTICCESGFPSKCPYARRPHCALFCLSIRRGC
ncbi:hypothetical protein CYLTODRAFT_73246 [Cylindrobasidium torrendii FP15055 ss-10]|uniref:DUF202 domain-containing protein n=1 Tax=Cylindrobasidium torrendii FP15055 ss-10 TaxID=1314674 RepID=A0A0D7B6J5_9AGAR|nr:hypothetical protein CYLTODRAFT_73246 [Cylindrobasidium torrendii FP15055 ss-10]